MYDLLMSDVFYFQIFIPHLRDSNYHSVLKLFTGFVIAALIAWKLTVNKVIINAPTPDAAKTHHDKLVLY